MKRYARNFKGRALGYQIAGCSEGSDLSRSKGWSPPVVSRMIVLRRHASPETTDGDRSQAVRQPAGLCIPLFRSHRHSGLPAALDARRTHRPFFPDVHGIYPITKQALRQRTQEYQRWVDAFAHNHRIPIECADDKALKAKGLKREDYVRPYGARPERRRMH
jgi:hypothetical protein